MVSRSGDDETFGILDKLTISYEGMHLKSVTSDLDAVEGVDFYGRTGWAGSLKELNVNGMSYNSAGMLSSDGSRGLANIRYNSNGLSTAFRANTRNPVRTLTQTYSASGVRLSQKEEMKYIDRRIVLRDRLYVGPFTFNTDTLERVDFAGGYFDGKGCVHFYHSDWQGNVTMVTDGHGQLEQHNGYYPYGEPWREPKGQHSRLFAGKERFEGLAKGTSDFGPRHHYPALAQWTGIDRLGHRNPRFNTYVFCAANPIKNIDPSGNDYFIFNTTGHLISREPDDKNDIIAITNQDGDFIESKPMKSGIIQSTYDIKIATGAYTTIKIRGDDEAKDIFEFFAENTKIEYSRFVCGIEGSSGLNFITTTHDEESEEGFGYLYEYQLKYGYTIRRFIHNHPSGGSSISDKDHKTANVLTNNVPNIELFMFSVPPGKTKGHYYKFDSKTLIKTALPIHK